jgi:hypothetical protein
MLANATTAQDTVAAIDSFMWFLPTFEERLDMFGSAGEWGLAAREVETARFVCVSDVDTA